MDWILAHDAVGNRLSALGSSPWNYNGSNQLTSTPDASFVYDNNGNTVSKTDASGETTYTWDYENRLTGITLPGTGGSYSFTYDPFGRRVKIVSPGRTVVYSYDGDKVPKAVASGKRRVSLFETLRHLGARCEVF